MPSVQFIILDPGHFHAALLQKSMYDGIDSTVCVFAPVGLEVKSHLGLVDKYNTRKENPTSWKVNVYTGADFLEKMLSSKCGNISADRAGVVIIAGNNRLKSDYIKKSINAQLNVLADKPMAINQAGFEKLQEAFLAAKKNKVLLYDIMTDRYNFNNTLQKEFLQLPDVFGELTKGTEEIPAIAFQSVHHFFKEVSGSPLVRPSWFFDVNQQGEGLVDVTTHMVDLVQWLCFPEALFNYRQDIKMVTARHWPTKLTPSQFSSVTKNAGYPQFLKKDVTDSLLSVYSNGEMNYTIKGVHARISINWEYKAPTGTGDIFFSVIRGTKTNLIIRSDREQGYKPTLYLEPADPSGIVNWQKDVLSGVDVLVKKYPGIALKQNKAGFEVVIPGHFRVDHEEQFSLVVDKYLQYLKQGNMPEWEISSMLAKYYTTTQALEKAQFQNNH